MELKKFPDSTFAYRIYRTAARIKKGSVVTYGELARRAGFPGAARAVGTLMRKNPFKHVPCHRVVCADGGVGSYSGSGDVEGKIRKLEREGVRIRNGKVRLS